MDRLLQALRRAADAVKRNERQAAWLVLGVTVVACLSVLTPPIRDRLLVRAQVVTARWEARWADRVERGEALIAEGRYDEAVTYLEQLDRTHPARHIKHGRDVERERILRALGAANLELGRKRASLDAFRRAANFDERNYLNHFALASAALELGEPDEAVAAYERVRAIHPNHLETVAAVVGHYFGIGDYPAVASVYEAYLDANLTQTATLRLGGGAGTFDLRVDGRASVVDVPLLVDPGSAPAAGDTLILEGGLYPFTVDRVSLLSPRRAGVLDTGAMLLTSAEGWTSRGDGDRGEVATMPIGSVTSVARVQLGVVAFKPVDAETWVMVERSYRNLLETRALEAARSRSVIIDPDSAGSGGRR